MATSGSDVAATGATLTAFAALGLAWVHFVVPRLTRLLGFGSWRKARWVRRWNYGLLLVLACAGAITMIVGGVAWAAGWSLG